MTKHRRFTMEFADEAVRLVRMSGRTRRQIADDLGVSFSTLARWISERRDREIGVSSGECNEDMASEIQRLRRENERLRQERDILKKAAVVFGRK